MFNLFKKDPKQAANNTETAKSEQFKDAADTNSAPTTEKKKVHGEDGVCCGSCGGE